MLSAMMKAAQKNGQMNGKSVRVRETESVIEYGNVCVCDGIHLHLYRSQ